VIATMARSMMNAQRRGGMVGAYTEASGALNVEERTALRRLARHYLDVNRERVTKERADVTLQAAQDEADRLQVCPCIRVYMHAQVDTHADAHADTHADTSLRRTLALHCYSYTSIHFHVYHIIPHTDIYTYTGIYEHTGD